MANFSRGIIIDCDYAVLDGSEVLYTLTRDHLEKIDNISLDPISEARYLFGKEMLNSFTDYFAVVKTKKTAVKAAKEVDAAFRAKLAELLPAALTPSFKTFVQTLADKGCCVKLVTHAALESVQEAFKELLSDKVSLYHDKSRIYGTCDTVTWRRVIKDTGLLPSQTVVLAGTGFGVHMALISGMGSLAMVHDHVAYQDFGGADAVMNDFSAAEVRRAIQLLRL